jgi:hypothetical protein
MVCARGGQHPRACPEFHACVNTDLAGFNGFQEFTDLVFIHALKPRSRSEEQGGGKQW